MHEDDDDDDEDRDDADDHESCGDADFCHDRESCGDTDFCHDRESCDDADGCHDRESCDDTDVRRDRESCDDTDVRRDRESCGRADDDVRCSAAALDLAVPVDSAAASLRPLERLDGRWSMQSMPQHVNLIAYGSQFTGATWPSFGRRRRRLRGRPDRSAADDERPEGGARLAAAESDVRRARQSAWRRFFSRLCGRFRLSLLTKRADREPQPRFKCTTL